jgi:hypothetical protein
VDKEDPGEGQVQSGRRRRHIVRTGQVALRMMS